MGNLNDNEQMGTTTKVFFILYLTVRLIILLCLLPVAYVFYALRNAVSKGFGWLSTEP
jgi:hypothetical protein